MSKPTKAPKDGGRLKSFRGREIEKGRERWEVYVTSAEREELKKVLCNLRRI
jgi:hypothetical protein